jgi:hypothetical protein
MNDKLESVKYGDEKVEMCVCWVVGGTGSVAPQTLSKQYNSQE